MKLRFLLLVAIFVMFETVAFAASPSSILVNVAPSNPAPYENTNITLTSYANNLDSVLISWSVDGKNVLSGIGKKSFLVKAPASGSETVIAAVVSLPDGEIEKRIVIKPSTMVLLFQANDSYVPPFYKGKALPTLDSEVKVVAMPEIKTGSGLIDSQNMTYVWRKDYTNIQDASGYGKNFFIYTNDYLEDLNNISVTASTIDQNSSVAGSISVGMSDPKLLFYKNDSALGVLWDKALASSHKIQGPEIITAIPYFISPKEIQNPRLIWNWSINGGIVNILGYRKNVIPLQSTSGVSGTSNLKLMIENQDKIFQTVGREINIEF